MRTHLDKTDAVEFVCRGLAVDRDTIQRVVGAFLAVTTSLVAVPAIAQQSEDVTRCVNKGNQFSADLAISGCTGAIQSRKWSGRDLAWAYTNRGHAYIAKGDYDRAITDFNRTIEVDPRNGLAYINRSHAYERKKEYDRALADAMRGVELAPREVMGFVNRAAAYIGFKDYNSAIADTNRAIQLAPGASLAFLNRAFAYEKLGERDRAIADYRRTLELDPNKQFARDALKSLGAQP